MTTTTYRCCACCAAGVDPDLHAEKGFTGHDVNCTTCDGNADLAVVAERDAALAKLEAVRKYADERAWYGQRNRTVGSNRIASDLLAILDK